MNRIVDIPLMMRHVSVIVHSKINLKSTDSTHLLIIQINWHQQSMEWWLSNIAKNSRDTGKLLVNLLVSLFWFGWWFRGRFFLGRFFLSRFFLRRGYKSGWRGFSGWVDGIGSRIIAFCLSTPRLQQRKYSLLLPIQKHSNAFLCIVIIHLIVQTFKRWISLQCEIMRIPSLK